MESLNSAQLDPMLQPYSMKRYDAPSYSLDPNPAVAILNCAPFWRRFGLRCGRHVWIVKDICGIICCVITYMLILYATFVVMCVIMPSSHGSWLNFVNGLIFYVFATLAFSSHVRTVVTDPGAIPRGNATDEHIRKLGLRDGQVVFKCPKCVSIKPERAHHCSVCRRCIKKMDHHCPWVNNCVGENNQKYFVLFTMYICLMSFHALYLAIQKFITCATGDWRECSIYSAPATTIFLITLLFEALLFAMFTAIMFGTQMSSICSDETGIEQLKTENPTWEKKSWWLSLKAVFGHPFSLKWFSPFHIPIIGKDQVYLYNV